MTRLGSSQPRPFPVATVVVLLVVFAGLPGSGKSVLARGVADAIGTMYLRIDTIESAIVWALMPFRDNPVGYVVAERVAADQLAGGRDVVAEAVDGVTVARAGWVALAARTGAVLRFVEVRCSDVAEHRRRVEGREPEMPGQGVPRWEQVLGAGMSRGRRSWPAGWSWTTSATQRDISRTLSGPLPPGRDRTGSGAWRDRSSPQRARHPVRL